MQLKGNLQKNISPLLGVIRWAIRFSTKISPTLWVFYKHQPFRRKPFSLWLISLAEIGKNAVAPCDGIGLYKLLDQEFENL